LRKRLKRVIKRLLRYLYNIFLEISGEKKRIIQSSTVNEAAALNLKQGDMVRVRSREEIRSTLDRWNSLKGCTFMEEMWSYCGTTHHVMKRVDRFLDERTYLSRKCRGVVLLDKAICNGTKDFGPCDRSCFLFWREEWLQKVDTK